jgi:hypothetical protein
LNEMELVVRAGLIFSEALCQISASGNVFLTDYNQNFSNCVCRMKADLVAYEYLQKTWPERSKYYDLKIDELVGQLSDEQLMISDVSEPNSCIM